MLLQRLRKHFPNIKANEPLKNHCTFRVGGPADFFYELLDINELPQIIEIAQKNGIKCKIIGRGTNILFTDKGVRGMIIKNIANKYEIHGNEIIADSGVLMANLVKAACENSLSGLELWQGIPGSIGAAVWGNAGIPNTEIGNLLKELTIFEPTKGIQKLQRNDISFSYRYSSLQNTDSLIMRVTLALKEGEMDKSENLAQKTNKMRKEKQPIGFSAGSFFKNPSPDKPAGYLLDQVGMKGMKIGDAQISEKHANFFMNLGNATSAQILELAALAQKKVKEKFNIDLEMEVKIIGAL